MKLFKSMLNFKPEGGGELVESSDDLDAVNGADMEDSDIDSDDSDSDDDTDGTDAEDIADVGEEAGSSKTKENPFFDGSDSGDDSFEDSEDDEPAKKEAEEEEEDDLIKALKAARQKKERNCPADIKTSELITDLSFHPEAEVITIGNISGDLSVFRYSNQDNKLEKKLRISKKTIRGIEFNEAGDSLLTVSKDKSFRILDTETWTVRYVAPLYCLLLKILMMTCEYLLLDRHEINLSTFQLNGNILINN